MKISNVQAQLTGNDILSIINEFVKVDGLDICNANIYGNRIEIEGSFKRGVGFDFSGIIEIEGVIGGVIYARFSKFKVLNLGIFRIIKNFALNRSIKAMDVKGIGVKKDKIIIDLQKVLIDVPYVSLKPKNLYIKDGAVFVEIEELDISIAGNLIKEDLKEDDSEEKEEEKKSFKESLEYPINKVEDCYTKGRNNIEEKIPEGMKKAKDILFIIPDIAALIFRLLKDKRVPTKTKLCLSAAVAYITFPIDFIPDNLPFIGTVDDIGIAIFALNKIINDVPAQVIAENWEGNIDLLSFLNNILEYLNKFTNANNVEKFYNIIEELSTL